MIIAYGIDGDGYKFRFGIKSDRIELLRMPKFTGPFVWPPVNEIKRTLPRLDEAKDGQWCWIELPL